MGRSTDRIWVSRVAGAVPGVHPCAAALLAMGWPPIALTYGVHRASATPWTGTFSLAQTTAALLIAVLPTFVWYYDEVLLPEFFERADRIVRDRAVVTDAAERHQRLFARRFRPMTAAWTVLILAVFLGSGPALASQGIGGPASPAYWLYFLFFLWGGIVTGIGFHGVLTTILAVRALVDADAFGIDPRHPDGNGGLSPFGYFAVRTTMLVASGSLLLPLAYELVVGGALEEAVYAAIACYTLFIALSFAYPALAVKHRAERARRRKLEELRERIRTLRESLAAERADLAETEELSRELRLQRLEREYATYERVSLYPISGGIATRFVGSTLMPVVTFATNLGIPGLI